MANVGSLIPALLLAVFLVAVMGGATISFLVLHWRRRQLANLEKTAQSSPEISSAPTYTFVRRPSLWLAVRSRNTHSVQMALGLNNAQPCTWLEGLSGDERLFIAPPVKGWVLVIGCSLPDPADDVDVCFRFLTNLSHKLGQVQFFHADRVLGHHAWVRLDNGRVTRAYAWAGKT